MINSIEIFDIMFENNIVVSYIGPFHSDVLAVIAENIESALWENPASGRKFFKIFIELAQNISLYSAEVNLIEDAESGVGILLISEYDDHFQFMAGNIVLTNSMADVIKKCEIINTLDREGLREYKRQMRSLPHGAKGGGNIGLIQVALISGYPIDYRMINIDDERSFYIVSVRIDK